MLRRTQYAIKRPTRLGRAQVGRPMETGAWEPTVLRLLVGIALLLAMAAILWFAVLPAGRELSQAYSAWQEPNPVAMPVPVPGTRKLDEAAVQLLITDDSGSMLRNDPDRLLPLAVQEYGRWLERHGRSRDRFAVVRFADHATSSGRLVTPRRLTGGVDALADVPQDGRYTKLGPAVDEVERVLADAPRRARRTALVLTDGEVVDPKEMKRLRRQVDDVEVVVIDRNGTWDRARSHWRERGVRLTRARNQRPNELGAEMARSFMRMTGERAR